MTLSKIANPYARTATILLFGMALASLPAVAGAEPDGINRLKLIAAQKAEQANQDAIESTKPSTTTGQTTTTPPPPAPKPRAIQRRQADKAQMIADGRALLVEAEKVSAGYRPAEGAPSKADLDASIDQVKSNLDSMSEMGEMESLRLQMAMDRMSKMMSTLSNMLKKISDTAQGITQNIK